MQRIRLFPAPDTYGATRGFSLVELSIVLVILGLLTGGILGGRELIKAAELRAVNSEYQQWLVAVNSFQQKYRAIPGDMRNATRFWGRADNGSHTGQCASPGGDEGTGTQTCNGDGDGRVGIWGAPGPYYESFRLWQHLANAGLVPGQYTGIHGTGGSFHHENGKNAPPSKFGSAGWNVEHLGEYGGDSLFYSGNYGNYFEFGGETADNCHEAGIMTPAELWNLDTKMDDGKPGKGFLVAGRWNECTLSDDEDDLEGEYDLENDSAVCFVNFRNAF